MNDDIRRLVGYGGGILVLYADCGAGEHPFAFRIRVAGTGELVDRCRCGQRRERVTPAARKVDQSNG